jgi:hypothetical protein
MDYASEIDRVKVQIVASTSESQGGRFQGIPKTV